MQETKDGQAKVVFPIEEGAEVLWCDVLGDDRYRIDNIPLFAYGISLGDTVAAKKRDDARPHFDHVLAKSGNRTCRVVIAEGRGNEPAVLHQIQTLATLSDGHVKYGLEYDAFNISSDKFSKAQSMLNVAERDGLWEWELSSDIS